MPVITSVITERLYLVKGSQSLTKKVCVYVSLRHINLLVDILLKVFEIFFFFFFTLPEPQFSDVSASNILFRFQITSPAGPPHVIYFQTAKPVHFMQHLQMKIIPKDI